MGDSKRRKQIDQQRPFPRYGTPEPWTLELLTAHPESEPIAPVVFQVRRQASAVATTKKAQALAVVIMSFLIEPETSNRDMIREALDAEGLTALTELQKEMPDRFWSKLWTPSDDYWVFASELGVAPPEEANDMQPLHSTEVYHRAIA